MSRSYLLRRLLLAVPTLFGVLAVVFVLLRVVPGDPIAMMLGPGSTEADLQRLRELYGFDGTLAQQFIGYLGDIFSGDFGTSIVLRQDVLELIVGRLPVTLELSAVAIMLAMAIGLAFAVAAVYWSGGWIEAAVDAVSGIVQAIPDFLWALLFILVLGILAPIMPVSGRIALNIDFSAVTGFYLIESLVTGRFDAFASVVYHIALPAAALALPMSAIIARVLKSSLKEAMTEDYVLLARIKGFSRWRVVTREALRNALIPTVTLTGVQLTFLIGGTVLVERIYGYPGLGNMAIDAVINRDLPLIQGIVLTFAIIFIGVNLIVDLSYALLNPRLRHG